MRRIFLSGIVALATAASLVVACSGDDNNVTPAGNDGGKDATGTDATSPTDAGDAGSAEAGDSSTVEVDAGDAASSYLLLSYWWAGYTKSSFVAYRLGDLTTAGAFEYPGAGSHVSGATSPWVLEQGETNLVHKMDAVEPWKVVSTWNVAVPKTNDAGYVSSSPSGVAEGGGKGYVSLFARNKIAVVDLTAAADGGAPSKLIDVSRWVQPQDGDGYVDMSDVVYVPSQNRVYVLLGNIDTGKVTLDGTVQFCDGAKSSIGAIDVTTDTIVDLGDPSVASGTLPLQGVSPLAVTYDAKNDRLIVVTAGCNDPTADGGVGPLRGRGIDEVKIAAKTTKTLLDVSTMEYPSKLTYVDETHAFLSFFSGSTFRWDPTSPTLGARFPTPPDTFVYDGKGALLGPKANVLGDGGIGSVDLISARTDDAGVSVLRKGAVPTSLNFFEAISIWANH